MNSALAESFRYSRIGQGLPRPVEAALAFVGLTLSAPVIGLLALAVKVSSPGGVFFKQHRAGKNGKSFILIKLRTMKASEPGPHVTERADSRVTRVGRFLRMTKLDELPELWNVLRGDMSLVGPRPEVPCFVDLRDVRWQTVLRARPGLTDPVTLRLRNEEHLLSEVGGDLECFYRDALLPVKLSGYIDYLESRSWKRDVEVILKTAVSIAWPSRTPPPTVAQIRLEAKALTQPDSTEANR
jgi:lipopolysaccharide/colanic/teichoic acid biosynthesis glycosyltransferase